MSDKRKVRPDDTVVFSDETVRDLEELTLTGVLKDATLSLNTSGINTEPGKKDSSLSGDIEQAFSASSPEEDSSALPNDDTLGIDLEED